MALRLRRRVLRVEKVIYAVVIYFVHRHQHDILGRFIDGERDVADVRSPRKSKKPLPCAAPIKTCNISRGANFRSCRIPNRNKVM
jgi:hypothetical protein